MIKLSCAARHTCHNRIIAVGCKKRHACRGVGWAVGVLSGASISLSEKMCRIFAVIIGWIRLLHCSHDHWCPVVYPQHDFNYPLSKFAPFFSILHASRIHHQTRAKRKPNRSPPPPVARLSLIRLQFRPLPHRCPCSTRHEARVYTSIDTRTGLGQVLAVYLRIRLSGVRGGRWI